MITKTFSAMLLQQGRGDRCRTEVSPEQAPAITASALLCPLPFQILSTSGVDMTALLSNEPEPAAGSWFRLYATCRRRANIKPDKISQDKATH